MAKQSGSIWINGDYFHYIGQDGVEWRCTGTYLAAIVAGSAAPGSVYVDGPEFRYIDQTGTKLFRLQSGPFASLDSPSGAIWIADKYFHWGSPYPSQGRYYAHGDIAHQDGGGSASHVDTPHQDTSHADTHSDGGHGDTHGDAPHDDYHNDHSDNISHQDSGPPHDDRHGDHGENLFPHGDCNFTDSDGNVYGHSDHMDTFNHGYHCDWHVDKPHTDVPHQDIHVDSPHYDTPPVNTHTDGAHGDTHSDTPGANVPHQDHTDVTHADVTHNDDPTYIGP